MAVNFTGEAATLDLSEAGVTDPSEANVALSSYTDLGQPVTNAGELRPYEAVVIDVN